MSTIIKFDLKELRQLTSDKESCVVEQKVTQNLALRPWCLGNLKESIKSILDYKIGKFDKEFNGILLSYKNLRVLQNIGSIRNDNADIHFEVQADYFIFQPYVGATLRGFVNKKSSTHLGILVHRVFNVVIPRPTEEPGNKWIGTNIQLGQEIAFKIVVLDLYGALPYIRGEIDEKCLKESEGAEHLLQSKPDIINVSHVNFDKTKPSIQKPIEEEIPKSRQLYTQTQPKKKLKASLGNDSETGSTNKNPANLSKISKTEKNFRKPKETEVNSYLSHPEMNLKQVKKRKKEQ